MLSIIITGLVPLLQHPMTRGLCELTETLTAATSFASFAAQLLQVRLPACLPACCFCRCCQQQSPLLAASSHAAHQSALTLHALLAPAPRTAAQGATAVFRNSTHMQVGLRLGVLSRDAQRVVVLSSRSAGGSRDGGGSSSNPVERRLLSGQGAAQQGSWLAGSVAQGALQHCSSCGCGSSGCGCLR